MYGRTFDYRAKYFFFLAILPNFPLRKKIKKKNSFGDRVSIYKLSKLKYGYYTLSLGYSGRVFLDIDYSGFRHFDQIRYLKI